MNRETIIQMAREAGLAEVTDTAESLPADYVEALAKLCTLSVAKERDECAALVQANADACDTYSTARRILESNAAAIRARGEAV